MPAPLAKGIILLSSILVAAGIAAYENPEVRAWFEERRRRIALTLNEIADEFDLQRSTRRRRTSNDDASTREENSAEAVERRRRARQEIMERGLMMEQRQRAARERRATSSSFDDMVDSKGKLRDKDVQATATSLENQTGDISMRNRANQTQAIAQGSALANPFDDEVGGVIEEKAGMEHELQTLPDQSHTASQNTPLHIDTMIPGISTRTVPQSSEDLDNLTPTTSVAASTLLSDSGVMTPTSTQHQQSGSHEPVSRNHPEPIQSYQSIQEWASTASSGPASFYSPPESERNERNLNTSMRKTPSQVSSATASIIGTNDVVSEGGDLGIDALSDMEADTPMSWSEVGSQVSED